MRQYSRPPEGHDYDSDDHSTAAIIASGIVAFSCFVLIAMIVCVKGCA